MGCIRILVFRAVTKAILSAKVTLLDEVSDLQISEPISKLKEPSSDRPKYTAEPTPESNVSLC